MYQCVIIKDLFLSLLKFNSEVVLKKTYNVYNNVQVVQPCLLAMFTN